MLKAPFYIESKLPLEPASPLWLCAALSRPLCATLSLKVNLVAVADVFDALTSRRPYKEARSAHEAFRELRKLADNKLARACVEALIKHRAQVDGDQATLSGKPSWVSRDRWRYTIISKGS